MRIAGMGLLILGMVLQPALLLGQMAAKPAGDEVVDAVEIESLAEGAAKKDTFLDKDRVEAELKDLDLAQLELLNKETGAEK